MTATIYLIGTALTWGTVGALVAERRDRGRARLGFISSAAGGMAGWAIFGTVGAMAFFAMALSGLALALTFRPARRRAAPVTPLALPVRHTEPAVERAAS